MAVADITLTNPNVNGGTAVVLGGARVSYSWKNIYDTNTVPCKYDISEASFNGFESPIITIEGASRISSVLGLKAAPQMANFLFFNLFL